MNSIIMQGTVIGGMHKLCVSVWSVDEIFYMNNDAIVWIDLRKTIRVVFFDEAEQYG